MDNMDIYNTSMISGIDYQQVEDESTLISSLPSNIEFNDGISLTSTEETLEVLLNRQKIKRESNNKEAKSVLRRHRMLLHDIDRSLSILSKKL